MFSDAFDEMMRKESGLEYYSQNNNFFRSVITLEDYRRLPRVKFEHFLGEEPYKFYVRNYPPAVFIDMSDINQFLKSKREPGFDAINIEIIADVTCGYIGNNADIYEVLWNTFDEDVTAQVQAQLGVDEHNYQMTVPFNTAMGLVCEISQIVQSYLINSGYPLIEEKSIYTVGKSLGGLLGLRLRTYDELTRDYG